MTPQGGASPTLPRLPRRRVRVAAVLLALAGIVGADAFLAEDVSAQSADGAAALPPTPQDGVYDGTSSLDVDQRRQVARHIDSAARQGGARLGVALVPDTGGRTIEAYGADLFRAWRMGDGARARGVLLVVAVRPRSNRIVVGGGLRDRVSDDEARRILTEVFRPAARAAGPGEATLRTVVAIRALLVRPAASPAEPRWGLRGGAALLGAIAAFMAARRAAAAWGERRRRANEREALARDLAVARSQLDHREEQYLRLAARGLLALEREGGEARFAAWRARLRDVTRSVSGPAPDLGEARRTVADVHQQSDQLLAATELSHLNFEHLRERLHRLEAEVAGLPDALRNADACLVELSAHRPGEEVEALRSPLVAAERDAVTLPVEAAALAGRFTALDSEAAMRSLSADVAAAERRVASARGAAAAPGARRGELARAEADAKALWAELQRHADRVEPAKERTSRFMAAFAKASQVRATGDPISLYAALLAAKACLAPPAAPAATSSASGAGAEQRASDPSPSHDADRPSSHDADGPSSHDADGPSSHGPSGGSDGGRGGASSDW